MAYYETPCPISSASVVALVERPHRDRLSRLVKGAAPNSLKFPGLFSRERKFLIQLNRAIHLTAYKVIMANYLQKLLICRASLTFLQRRCRISITPPLTKNLPTSFKANPPSALVAKGISERLASLVETLKLPLTLTVTKIKADA